MADNKVVFGLRNAHYSIITEGEGGDITYSVPVPLKGAVEISLEPRGETTDFYADDILYYTTVSNQGYETTLTVANIPQERLLSCLNLMAILKRFAIVYIIVQ